jgi:hypothetical protein
VNASPKRELQAVWKEIVDAASLLIVLDAAVMTINDVPEPKHISVLLNQLQRQLLDAANRLDIAMQCMRDGAS